MKKLLFLLVFSVICLGLSAQSGRVKTLQVDTLKGNNSKVLAEINLTRSADGMAIKVQVDRVSTAAGGTLYLKTGIDAASAAVANQSTNPSIEFQANDTLATTDVATQYWNIVVTSPAQKYFAIYGDGDVNDTIKVTTSYIYK